MTELDRCIRNEFFLACISKGIIKFLLECFVFILLSLSLSFSLLEANTREDFILFLFPFQRCLDCEELSRTERLATANIFIRSLKSHPYECPGTCRCPRPLEILSPSRGKPQSGKFRLRRNQQTVNSSSILARTASFPYFLANGGRLVLRRAVVTDPRNLFAQEIFSASLEKWFARMQAASRNYGHRFHWINNKSVA